LNIAKEFSRFAQSYSRVNIIQKQIVRELITQIEPKKEQKILDLGCGNGAVFNELRKQRIDFRDFIGVDIAPNMLALHPKEPRVELLKLDFENPKLLDYPSDIVVSASALQWSKNLDQTLSHIANLADNFYFAIFTANTFKTLHQLVGIDSPIYSLELLQNSINKYYTATYRTNSYKLYFDSTYEMLRYIKSSGVSGGKKKLSYKQMKYLIAHYPLNYLEFEVVFVKANRLK